MIGSGTVNQLRARIILAGDEVGSYDCRVADPLKEDAGRVIMFGTTLGCWRTQPVRSLHWLIEQAFHVSTAPAVDPRFGKGISEFRIRDW